MVQTCFAPDGDVDLDSVVSLLIHLLLNMLIHSLLLLVVEECKP